MSKKQVEEVIADSALTFSSTDLMPQPKRDTWKYMLPLWLAIATPLLLEQNLGWDVFVIGYLIRAN